MVGEPAEVAPPSAPRRRWRLARLTWVVVLLVLWNAVVLWLAFTGTPERDDGSDAAGLGLVRAFRESFALAAGAGVGVLVLAYLAIRNATVRVVLAAGLLVASVLTPMLIG